MRKLDGFWRSMCKVPSICTQTLDMEYVSNITSVCFGTMVCSPLFAPHSYVDIVHYVCLLEWWALNIWLLLPWTFRFGFDARCSLLMNMCAKDCWSHQWLFLCYELGYGNYYIVGFLLGCSFLQFGDLDMVKRWCLSELSSSETFFTILGPSLILSKLARQQTNLLCQGCCP
jgi:hypothetical protein